MISDLHFFILFLYSSSTCCLYEQLQSSSIASLEENGEKTKERERKSPNHALITYELVSISVWFCFWDVELSAGELLVGLLELFFCVVAVVIRWIVRNIRNIPVRSFLCDNNAGAFIFLLMVGMCGDSWWNRRLTSLFFRCNKSSPFRILFYAFELNLIREITSPI